MLILSHAFNIIIGRYVVAPVHGRETVDGLNKKGLISMLITNVKLLGSKGYEKYMAKHTSTQKYVISMASELKNKSLIHNIKWCY